MKPNQNFHPLSQSLNLAPSHIRLIHLMGICGTGMAALAGALRELGYEIRGSDSKAYPPMSTFLEGLGIQVLMGFGPQNLNPRPDLVIVGNVITRDNPEVQGLAAAGVPFLSFPQALNHFVMKGKSPIVIAGTHGKTTTSSLVAWLLDSAGLSPGFMIGGIPTNFEKGFKLGSGQYFVIEGDEYDTAFFDKGPKFFHYHPETLILTSIEYDHADIYDSLEQIVGNFRRLVEMVPPQGHIIANSDDPIVADVVCSARCPVITYGLESKADWRIEGFDTNVGNSFLRIRSPFGKQISLRLCLYGGHNMANVTAMVALGGLMGIDPVVISKAAQTFKGVKRRQELLGEVKGITVFDDFAHHPTAVAKTIAAIKGAFPRRRLVAVFEPRSNSSRTNVFQEKYAEAFDHADLVMVPEPTRLKNIPPAQRFSSKRLVAELSQQGKQAYHGEDTRSLLDLLLKKIRPGDVVLFMSNGDFEGLPHSFVQALSA